MTIKDNESAIGLLIESSKLDDIFSENGDFKKANKNFDIMLQVVAYLRNNNGIKYLKTLLNYPEISVQIAAATFLLKNEDKEPINVLKKISMLNIPHKSVDASSVLQEWKKGNITL